MEGYGVGPRTLWLLQQFWDQLVMVVRVSGYYTTSFKMLWGVTQGVPVSPKVFNILVDVVVRNWITVLVEKAPGVEGFNRAVNWMAALFYANYGLLVSNQLE